MNESIDVAADLVDRIQRVRHAVAADRDPAEGVPGAEPDSRARVGDGGAPDPDGRVAERRTRRASHSVRATRVGALHATKICRTLVIGRACDKYSAKASPTSLGKVIPPSRDALPRNMA
ncbi:hypothetical protein [Rhodococcus opacus]|uniref:hypothetical protein n=1 Tax=Rhodococcus opacus TaxID=37919 RepID=UPI001009D13B|nr:hypothetical protein [Rhodococcus opacus]